MSSKKLSIEEEERTRTLTFGNWPKNKGGSIIRTFIADHMKEVEQDLDEDSGVFAYCRGTASRRAARFKTTALMLKYIRSPETEWKFKHENHDIYINRDMDKPQEEVNRDRQINKLIRAVIEYETGVDGDVTRKLIVARRKRGIVEYKGTKIGKLIDGQMVLPGDGEMLRQKYEALLAQ